MSGNNKLNFWLDVVILVAFVATALTGLALWLVVPGGRGNSTEFLGLARRGWIDLHLWAGLVMLAGVGAHLVLHRRWIMCAARRLFAGLARQARLNFWLDSLLFAAFFLAGLSGLVGWLVLPGGGYRGGRNPYFNAGFLGLARHAWSDLHLWAGLVMLAGVGLHLFLHWRWLVCVVRRYSRAASCRPDECLPA